MLYTLGMFVFQGSTLLPDALSRARDWKHPRTDRFGALSSSQYTGPGDDKITLTGTLVPEITGSYASIATLASMAAAGDAYILIDGTGTVFGQYTIDRLEEKWSNIIDNGKPRRVDFTLELSRVEP